MSALSSSPAERARKAHSAVLRAMEEPGTARNVALTWGVAESTVSRAKDTLDNALALVYQLGFKVVGQDRICVDRTTYEAMVHIATKAMSNKESAQRLVWEDE